LIRSNKLFRLKISTSFSWGNPFNPNDEGFSVKKSILAEGKFSLKLSSTIVEQTTSPIPRSLITNILFTFSLGIVFNFKNSSLLIVELNQRMI